MKNRSPAKPNAMQTFEKSRQLHGASLSAQLRQANGSEKALERQVPSVNGLDPPSAVAICVAATALLLGGYTAVFAITLEAGPAESLGTAVANVLPLALLSAVFYRALRDVILERSVLFQASSHVLMAPLFAGSWYFLTLIALATLRAAESGAWTLGRFSGVALVWQLFQGLVLYALVAASTYALRGGRAAARIQLVEQGAPLERYLTRTGDELRPIAVEDIVCIRGAQDYAEVSTIDGKSHLVRLSLAEFEQRLPSHRFVRVHRSTIVSLAHLSRAEPIGSGRFVLHMAGGNTVEASRSGVQALREMVL